jgi:hypothetical protein
VSPATLALLIACQPEANPVGLKLQAMSFANSEWSEPANLGAPINSASLEASPTLSKDGLVLYFTSNRPGGLGLQDLWVSRRGCVECPWQEPINLGAPINSAAVDNGANLSGDGHLLFFFSGRPGGRGSTDIYVSHRADPKDDFGWEEPVNLGPDVNTATADQKPWYLQSAEDGAGNLYFSRGEPTAGAQDIYYAPVTRDGETRGPAVFVSELNDPTGNDAGATVRADGREVFFSSFRPGGLGLSDLWTSTRRSVHDAWDTPVHLGAAMSSTAIDQQTSLSHDGRTLAWASDRPGGLGGLDIWMSTRTPSRP